MGKEKEETGREREMEEERVRELKERVRWRKRKLKVHLRLEEELRCLESHSEMMTREWNFEMIVVPVRNCWWELWYD